jgi:amidase
LTITLIGDRTAPIILTPAFRHFDLAIPQTERTVNINGQSVPYLLQLFYPSLGNLSGFPATAFPLGLHSSGLPIGVQAIGPYLEDLPPIRFARLVAQEFGGFQAPSGYR